MIAYGSDSNRRVATGTDVVLAERAGDPTAFGELIKTAYPRLLRTARRVLRNSADAEDAVQEALYNALIHIREYRYDFAFSAWLLRITVNQAITLIGRRKPEVAWLDSPLRPLAGPNPEQTFLDKEYVQVLTDGISRLPLLYRSVLSLSELEDLSNSEIAAVLELKENNVKVCLHRGRPTLHRILAGSNWRISAKSFSRPASDRRLGPAT